jgi:hypothetical protein
MKSVKNSVALSLEEQSIGVALIDSFFLNRAHHWIVSTPLLHLKYTLNTYRAVQRTGSITDTIRISEHHTRWTAYRHELGLSLESKGQVCDFPCCRAMSGAEAGPGVLHSRYTPAAHPSPRPPGPCTTPAHQAKVESSSESEDYSVEILY